MEVGDFVFTITEESISKGGSEDIGNKQVGGGGGGEWGLGSACLIV